MHGSFYQYPIAWGNPAKLIPWKEPGVLLRMLFWGCGCFFFIRFLFYDILHRMENACVFPSTFHSMGKCSKAHPLKGTWGIGTILFPKVWVLILIMRNTWVLPSISHSVGRCNKPIHWREPGELVPMLSPNYGRSLPLDSHLMVCFITRKMHRSSRRCPIALEKATKPIFWEEPRMLVPILFPKIHHRLCSNAKEMHMSSRQCP